MSVVGTWTTPDERQKLQKWKTFGWIAAILGAVSAITVFLFPITLIGSVVSFGAGLGMCYRKGFGWSGAKLMLGSLIGPFILAVMLVIIYGGK